MICPFISISHSALSSMNTEISSWLHTPEHFSPLLNFAHWMPLDNWFSCVEGENRTRYSVQIGGWKMQNSISAHPTVHSRAVSCSKCQSQWKPEGQYSFCTHYAPVSSKVSETWPGLGMLTSLKCWNAKKKKEAKSLTISEKQNRTICICHMATPLKPQAYIQCSVLLKISRLPFECSKGLR